MTGPAGAAFTSTPAASADDAIEQKTTTTVTLTDTAMDLVNSTGGSQYFGVRFPSLAIPNGSFIVSAKLSMHTPALKAAGIDAKIFGELADAGTQFVATAANISGRARTAANVAWSATWNDGSAIYRDSPDVSLVLQEIVNRAGWVSGNALNLILVAQSSTHGQFDLFDGGFGAILTVTVNIVGSPAGSDDASELQNSTSFSSVATSAALAASTTGSNARRSGGVRFPGVNIPQGATIDSAVLTFDVSAGGSPNWDIQGEAVDNSVDFVSNAHIISRSKTTAVVTYATTGLAAGQHDTPDIKTVIQEIVNRAGWVSGNALMIFLQGRSDVTQTCTVRTVEATGGTSPHWVLKITYHTNQIATLQRATVVVTPRTISQTARVSPPLQRAQSTATPRVVAAPAVVRPALQRAQLTATPRVIAIAASAHPALTRAVAAAVARTLVTNNTVHPALASAGVVGTARALAVVVGAVHPALGVGVVVGVPRSITAPSGLVVARLARAQAAATPLAIATVAFVSPQLGRAVVVVTAHSIGAHSDSRALLRVAQATATARPIVVVLPPRVLALARALAAATGIPILAFHGATSFNVLPPLMVSGPDGASGVESGAGVSVVSSGHGVSKVTLG